MMLTYREFVCIAIFECNDNCWKPRLDQLDLQIWLGLIMWNIVDWCYRGFIVNLFLSILEDNWLECLIFAPKTIIILQTKDSIFPDNLESTTHISNKANNSHMSSVVFYGLFLTLFSFPCFLLFLQVTSLCMLLIPLKVACYTWSSNETRVKWRVGD